MMPVARDPATGYIVGHLGKWEPWRDAWANLE